MLQTTKSAGLAMIAVVASLAFAVPASAAFIGAFTSSGTCGVGDFDPTADDCFGTVLPEPTNDSNTDLNQSTFGGVTGLFGITDWDLLTKLDIGGSGSGADIGLDVDLGAGSGPHTWSVDAGSLDMFDRIAIVLKQGRTWAAYLFEGTIPESGEFFTSAFEQPNGLSHFSIYTGPRVPEVPIPAAGLLLIGALGGLGLASRRRRRA